MSAIWIAVTYPVTESDEDSLLGFLNGPHAAELLAGIPEVESYVSYREVLTNGTSRFLSIGRSSALTGDDLRDRIYSLAPDLTPNPFVSTEEGKAPALHFADET